MTQLYIYLETTINQFNSLALDLLYFPLISFGVFVIVYKNPVISVLFLIGLFFCIAIYLIMIGCDFIGISYLLVYVGAVSILFIFILMLINIRISELISNTNNSILLLVMIVLSISITIISIIPNEFIYKINSYETIMYFTDNNV